MAYPQSLPPFCFCGQGTLAKTCPYQVDQVQFLLVPESGFQFPASLRITQTSQLHVLAGTKGHLDLLVLQSLSLTALVIHFFPSAAPLASGMVCNVLFPGC